MEESADVMLSGKSLRCFLQHTTWPGAVVIGKIKLACLEYMIRKRRCIIAGGWAQHIYQVHKGQPGLYDPFNPCAISDVDCYSFDPVGDFKFLIKRFVKEFPSIDFRITSGMAPGVFTLAMLGGSVHLSDSSFLPIELFNAFPTLDLDLKVGEAPSEKMKTRISHPLLEVARRNKMFAELYNFGVSDPESRLARLHLYQQSILTDVEELRSTKLPLPNTLKVSAKSKPMLTHLWRQWLPAVGRHAPLVGLAALDDVCDKVSLEVLVDSAYFKDVCQSVASMTFNEVSFKHGSLTGNFYEPLSGVCPTYLGSFELFLGTDVIARLHCGTTATTCQLADKKNKIFKSSYGHTMSYLALDWVAARKLKAVNIEAYFMYRLATTFEPTRSATEIAEVGMDKICGRLPARNTYLDYVKNRSKTRQYSFWSDRPKGRDEPNGPVRYKNCSGQVLRTIDFKSAADCKFGVPFIDRML